MRIDYFSHLPEFITPLRQLTRQQHDLTLPAPLRALLELRVSQLNGCVYCVVLHTKEARLLAVPAAQLDHLPVWQESPAFSVEEKAALAWAEALTLRASRPDDEAAFAALGEHFTEREIVEIGLCVSLANFWNRMAGGFRRLPGE